MNAARPLAALGALLLLATAGLGAQALDISRHAIAGGGGRSSGGEFVVTGTIGQGEAGNAPASGGAFRLRGGWLDGAATTTDALFGDGFEQP